MQVITRKVANCFEEVQLTQSTCKAVTCCVWVGPDHHGLFGAVAIDLEQPSILDVLLFDCALDEDLLGFGAEGVE